VALTRKQFAVLEVLVAAQGGVVSAEALLERAWDANADPFTNAVRITVSGLRKRLVEPWLIAHPQLRRIPPAGRCRAAVRRVLLAVTWCAPWRDLPRTQPRRGRGVTITSSGDPAPALGSSALLLQLTTNLVHNAIVHNVSERGTVSVAAGSRNGATVLTVENTWEQLSPQLVATLAEPFRRGSERVRRDHAGAGLGLAIVKSITEAHSGALTLAPRAEGGLHVTVRLPTAGRRSAAT
jgi:signal transduction histidine kinase